MNKARKKQIRDLEKTIDQIEKMTRDLKISDPVSYLSAYKLIKASREAIREARLFGVMTGVNQVETIVKAVEVELIMQALSNSSY